MKKAIIIESVGESGTEWGISFDGYNPNQADYFKMPDKETAFNLCKYLSNLELWERPI